MEKSMKKYFEAKNLMKKKALKMKQKSLLQKCLTFAKNILIQFIECSKYLLTIMNE